MKNWNEFTDEFSEASLLLVLSDYKEFCEASAIGDCFLRSKAEEWCENVGYGVNVINVMTDIANFAYKHFAERYFELAHITI